MVTAPAKAILRHGLNAGTVPHGRVGHTSAYWHSGSPSLKTAPTPKRFWETADPLTDRADRLPRRGRSCSQCTARDRSHHRAYAARRRDSYRARRPGRTAVPLVTSALRAGPFVRPASAGGGWRWHRGAGDRPPGWDPHGGCTGTGVAVRRVGSECRVSQVRRPTAARSGFRGRPRAGANLGESGATRPDGAGACCPMTADVALSRAPRALGRGRRGAGRDREVHSQPRPTGARRHLSAKLRL
jgi:hypothetical protein